MRKLFLLFFLIVISLMSVACQRATPFYKYEGIWASADLSLIINYSEKKVNFVLSETQYVWLPSGSIDGTTVEFFNVDITQGKDYTLTNANLVWYAKARIKNNRMELTIKQDNLFDYEGKTIVLDFYTYEEWDEKQKTE